MIIQEAGTLLDNRGLPTAVESSVEQLAADDKVALVGLRDVTLRLPTRSHECSHKQLMKRELGFSLYISDSIGQCLILVRSFVLVRPPIPAPPFNSPIQVSL